MKSVRVPGRNAKRQHRVVADGAAALRTAKPSALSSPPSCRRHCAPWLEPETTDRDHLGQLGREGTNPWQAGAVYPRACPPHCPLHRYNPCIGDSGLASLSEGGSQWHRRTLPPRSWLRAQPGGGTGGSGPAEGKILRWPCDLHSCPHEWLCDCITFPRKRVFSVGRSALPRGVR